MHPGADPVHEVVVVGEGEGGQLGAGEHEHGQTDAVPHRLRRRLRERDQPSAINNIHLVRVSVSWKKISSSSTFGNCNMYK